MPQPNADPSAAQQIAGVLADAYGLAGAEVDRVPAGQATINYRAEAQGRALFVKRYAANADLAAEAEAIGQTRLAGHHGVPVAEVVLSGEGEAISRHGHMALSVWEWAPGRMVEAGLSLRQQAAAGQALGRTHRAFARHPASGSPPPKLTRWLNPDLAKLEATIDRLQRIIRERTALDHFDEDAAATLTERRTMLHRVPALLDGLPPLTCQVLHGDYSAVNLLFDGDDLTAVLDFAPPKSFLVGYELGRIAFDPRSVSLTDDWIVSGTTLATAYLEENPHLAAADVTSCARVALIQLAVSLYGVKQHYLEPGLLQDDLDAFWLLRHRAAQRLLHHLDETEAALAKTVAQAASTPHH